MKYIYALFVLLLALFLAAFIQQNGTQVQLKYFSWQTVQLPLSLYIILSFAAGYVLAVVVGLSAGLRFRFRASGAEREVRQLRSELDQLKKDELKAVTSEFQSETQVGSGEPSRLDNTGMDEVDETGDGGYGDDQDPDDPTVLARTGGEEEK